MRVIKFSFVNEASIQLQLWLNFATVVDLNIDVKYTSSRLTKCFIVIFVPKISIYYRLALDLCFWTY